MIVLEYTFSENSTELLLQTITHGVQTPWTKDLSYDTSICSNLLQVFTEKDRQEPCDNLCLCNFVLYLKYNWKEVLKGHLTSRITLKWSLVFTLLWRTENEIFLYWYLWGWYLYWVMLSFLISPFQSVFSEHSTPLLYQL
jgi:hypothetical protein